MTPIPCSILFYFNSNSKKKFLAKVLQIKKLKNYINLFKICRCIEQPVKCQFPATANERDGILKRNDESWAVYLNSLAPKALIYEAHRIRYTQLIFTCYVSISSIVSQHSFSIGRVNSIWFDSINSHIIKPRRECYL